MSRETVPGHSDVTYHLLAYDEDGRERGHDSGEVLRAAESGNPSDVFVFSHGWNGDVPAAREQYGAWVATMANCTADRERARSAPGGFRSLLVGLHWPSKAWGNEDVGSASFEVDTVERLGGGPLTRAAVRSIVEAYREDAAPPSLPPKVRAAYELLDAADDEGTPEAEREAFDAERLYQGCLLEQEVCFGGLSFGGLLAPLRVLTFWKMKKRARTFGETGAAALVRALQQAAPDARIHLMGHSFGCIVASAAVSGAGRQVASMSLVQGAMSLWSFCDSIPAEPSRKGYFRRLVGDRLVRGPVVVSSSPHDRAVGSFYPLGAWSGRQLDFAPGELPKYGGIGAHGVRGPGIDVLDQDIRHIGELSPGKVHNLDARAVIDTSDGIAGAHNDICHPEVGHAVWQAVAGSR